MNTNNEIEETEKYEKFVAELLMALEDRLSYDNVNIERMTVEKINGPADGISIKYQDSEAAPTIYPQNYYDEYASGRDINEMADEIVANVKSAHNSTPTVPNITPEEAKKNIYFVLVNADANKSMLEHTPHEIVNDLALIPRWRIDEHSSFIVMDNMCSHLKMTSEEIMQIARDNTAKMHYNVETMESIIRSMMPPELDAESEPVTDDMSDATKMLVISNDSRFNGASAMMSKDIMTKACEMMDAEKIYILPSSIHEVIAVPDDSTADLEILQQMVRDINETQVAPQERLSDNVYHFDTQTKKVTIAEPQDKEHVSDNIIPYRPKAH